jgi:hypothetical protein
VEEEGGVGWWGHKAKEQETSLTIDSSGGRRSWLAGPRVAAERAGNGQAPPVDADLVSNGGDVLQERWR